jgi:endonuclease-3
MIKKRVKEILKLLDFHYGDTACYLDYETPWQLLAATILSAQCTDDRVNIVTKGLFGRFPTAEATAGAEFGEVEDLIKSTGLFRSKARGIVGSARLIMERHDGEVPRGIDELTALPAVGRKTANVVRGNIWGIPSVVVDTHVKRISNRLGFTAESDPVKVEFDLMKVLPKAHWIRFNTQSIALGRVICKAPNPKCAECFLTGVCTYGR